jgi:uncharacterized paraquat-inducible protein A
MKTDENGMQTLNETPGMPCPQCAFPIRIGMREFLHARYVECPRCLLRLEVDREKSARSIELLQSLAVALDNVEALKSQRPTR